MNLKTFKEAEQIFMGGMVQVINSTEDTAMFDVHTYDDTTHQVFVSNKGYLKIMCDCEYNGKKGEACGGLCKHKIAVIREIVRMKGKIRKV